MKNLKKFIAGISLIALSLLATNNVALADKSGNFWNQPTDAYVIPQDNSSGAHRNIGASGDKIPNGFFTNINVSGTCTGCGSGGGLPDQSGNSGKFLSTNGTAASWASLPVIDLVSALLNTASGAVALTPLNSAGFTVAIPIAGPTASTHTISFGVKDPDYDSFMDINAIGTGSGGAISGASNVSLNKRVHLVTPVSGAGVDLEFMDNGFSGPATDLLQSTQYGFFGEGNNNGNHTGGLFAVGATSNDAPGMIIGGITGSTTVSQAPVVILGAKSDGSTGIAPVSDDEFIFAASNGFASNPFGVLGDGSVYSEGRYLGKGAQFEGGDGATESLKITAAASGGGTSDIFFDLRNKSFATGNIGVQTGITIFAPTYDFVGASTISIAATEYMDASPSAGTNGIVTRSFGWLFDGGSVSAANARAIGIFPQGIANGFGNMTSLFAQSVELSPVNTDVSLGDQTALLGDLGSVRLGIIPYTSLTNNRSVTGDVATLLIDGAPSAGAHVGFVQDPYSIHVKANASRFDGRLLTSKGTDVASANNLALGSDGNFFHITGTTQINCLTSTSWTNGTEITFVFDGALTLKNAQTCAGSTLPFKLSGSADFSTAADSVLKVVVDSTAIREISRTAP